MSGRTGLWRATYTPGQWIVLAGPTSLVVMQPAPTHASALINDLWDALRTATGIQDVVERFAAQGMDRMPDFAAFFWAGGQMRSLVRGQIAVLDPDTGDTLADGEGIQTWSEVGLGTHTEVQVTMEDIIRDEHLRLPLVVGAVHASSVYLDATADVSSPQSLEAPAEEPPAGGATWTAPAPADEDEPAEGSTEVYEDPLVPGFDATPAGEDEAFNPFAEPPSSAASAAPMSPASVSAPPPPPGMPPLPPGPPPLPPSGAPGIPPPGPHGPGVPPQIPQGGQILAAICTHGHPNPPELPRCRRCGNPIQGQPRMIARPVLAVLRPPNGSPVPVDRPILIGRSPQANRVGRDELPTLLTVSSPSHDISRTHVQVAPDNWSILATDLHSTNGTVLIRPGQPEAERLAPGEAVALYPGCVLDLGDGVTIRVDHPS